MVARAILLGKHANLLDNLIVMIAPIFNVDGTDTLVAQDGSLGSETPYILGVRENSAGLDLNRDAVKLQTVEANGLYRMLNDWDPALLLDGHLMSRVSHGYANTYGTTTVPAAAPGPRDYMHDTLFPAVRDMVRRDFGLEVFTHALPARGPFPPTVWSHDAAAWTVEAKFIVNDYGLRNRLAIITETPGQPTFERRIYAQYAYIMALLDYTNAHAREMQAIVKAADDKTVADVLAGAEAGTLRNFLDGEYQSRGQDRSARVSDERARVSPRHEHPWHQARHGRRPARGGARRGRSRPSRSGRGPPTVPRAYLFPARTRRSRRQAPGAQRQDPAARCADAGRGRGVHDSEDAQGALERLRHDHARRDLLGASRGSSPRAPCTWTWRSRWPMRRSITSSRRRAMASSAGACSTRNCGRSAPNPNRSPIRSSRCGAKCAECRLAAAPRQRPICARLRPCDRGRCRRSSSSRGNRRQATGRAFSRLPRFSAMAPSK